MQNAEETLNAEGSGHASNCAPRSQAHGLSLTACCSQLESRKLAAHGFSEEAVSCKLGGFKL
jgi:hypothetical protein